MANSCWFETALAAGILLTACSGAQPRRAAGEGEVAALADRYFGTASAFVIMSRNFAPPDERLRSLVAREKQMPAVLEVARRNLKDPPRRYTEIALEQLPGILSFFEKDVPAAFKEAKEEATLRDFAQLNAQVLSALRAY